jgi:DNA-binding response OmpR family regulator
LNTIIVIEDEETVRENISLLLENEGYQVVLAGTGLTGLQQICEIKPDLVICDIKMPGLDGYQVLQIMRQDNGLAKIPFIFLTALSDRNNWRKGMELGADDYLTKPFTRHELLKAIDARLTRLTSAGNYVTEESSTAKITPKKPEHLPLTAEQLSQDPLYRLWLELALKSYPTNSLEKRLFRGEKVDYNELLHKLVEVQIKLAECPDEDTALVLHWLGLELEHKGNISPVLNQ